MQFFVILFELMSYVDKFVIYFLLVILLHIILIDIYYIILIKIVFEYIKIMEFILILYSHKIYIFY